MEAFQVKKKIFLAGFLMAFLFLVTFVFPGCQGEVRDKKAPATLEGEITAPSFLLEDLAGEKRALEDYKGSIVVINFWATWCPYCVAEMKYLEEIHLAEKDVAVLAVNVGESKNQVQKFMEKEGFTFTVLLDQEGETARKYQIRGLPTTFFLNERLGIAAIKIGAFDADELKELIQKAREK